MRLWSIHPKYLDCKGLIALWRESLLAQKVLLGQTKGYKNHPQLERFKNHPHPNSAIGSYLYFIYKEAEKRCHNFKKEKILIPVKKTKSIQVTKGQILFEFEHLKKKLETRDQEKYKQLLEIKRIESHPLFGIVNGNIEKWEKI
jgi:hypothetical protein